MLLQSFQEIMQRHEILRTVVVQEDGELFSKVLAVSDDSWSLIDYSNLKLSDHVLITHAVEMFKNEISKSFNLEVGPLIKFTMLKYSPTTHIVLLTMHHIVFDGWSFGVFFQELSDIYNAFTR